MDSIFDSKRNENQRDHDKEKSSCSSVSLGFQLSGNREKWVYFGYRNNSYNRYYFRLFRLRSDTQTFHFGWPVKVKSRPFRIFGYFGYGQILPKILVITVITVIMNFKAFDRNDFFRLTVIQARSFSKWNGHGHFSQSGKSQTVKTGIPVMPVIC